MKKRVITMPLPEGIDKDNKSGWRLSTVTPGGMYFYYVSYKNEVKETSYPILSFNLIKVDKEGKPGENINMDMELEKYNVLPASYNPVTPNLNVYRPEDLIGTIHTTSTGGGVTTYTYQDIAFMNLLIDEKNNCIYTFIAQNDEVGVNNDGIPKAPLNHSAFIKKITVKTFKYKGKSINSSTTKLGTFSRGATDDYTYAANAITLCLLPNNEGIVFHITNNDNGYTYALDKTGTEIENKKVSVFVYKTWGMHFKQDKFAVPYYSLKDYESSPYFLGLKSPVYQYFNKMDKKTKAYSTYLSLKNEEILTEYNGKDDKVKLLLFSKK